MKKPSKMVKLIRPIASPIRGMMRYLSRAIEDIFKPITDDYPDAGVQPYEREQTEQKSRRGGRFSW